MAAKNIAGTGPASIESTSSGTFPWPLLSWSSNCPANTCSDIPPELTSAPVVWTSVENEITGTSHNLNTVQYKDLRHLLWLKNYCSNFSITVAVHSTEFKVGSAIPFLELTCKAFSLDANQVVSPTPTTSTTVAVAVPTTAMVLKTDLIATTAYKVSCQVKDAGTISSTASSVSLAIYPTTKPPTPVWVKTDKSGLDNGKYSATLSISGLDARKNTQVCTGCTLKMKIKCQEKTDFIVDFVQETDFIEVKNKGTQTITISNLEQDTDYIFVCSAINEKDESSLSTTADIEIAQASTASQTQPDAPTINSIARDSTTGSGK